MQICLDMRTGSGCGIENPNHAYYCRQCGKPLRFALMLLDPRTKVGRYRIVRVIGYGAYGAVYEAYENSKPVASLMFSLHDQTLAIGSEGNTGIHLWHLRDRKRLVLRTKGYRHEKVVWSPNGQLLAAETSRKHLGIWHREGAQVKILKGHERGINDIAWHPTEDMIATAGDDLSIRIWSLKDPSLLYICRGHTTYVTQVAISPDGQTLASAEAGQTMRLWQLPKEHPSVVRTRTYPSAISEERTTADIMPFGCKLAACASSALTVTPSGGTTKKFNVSSRRRFPHIRCRLGGAIVNLAYSADGKMIICADEAHQVYHLRATDGKLEKVIPLSGPPTVDSIAFSPTGETIATAGEDLIIRIWQHDGQLLYELRGHNASITSLAYSPDGQILASAGNKDESVRIWRIADGGLLHLFEGEYARTGGY